MPILKPVTDVDIPSNCVSILLGDLLKKKKMCKIYLGTVSGGLESDICCL